MLAGKSDLLIIAAGVVVLGICVFAVVHPRLKRGDQRETKSPGDRLVAHATDREDYRLFVGVPSTNPTEWIAVEEATPSLLTLQNTEQMNRAEVTAYFVTYPNGVMVDYQCPDQLAFPPWVQFPEKSDNPDEERLTAGDIEAGQSLVAVTFGESTSHPRSRHHYSTTLTNISTTRIRVTKFGAYAKSGRGFILNTITGRFFTAEDFKEWYDQKGESLEPGESATDPNNYGSLRGLWAYYCESEDGTRFLTGGIRE